MRDDGRLGTVYGAMSITHTLLGESDEAVAAGTGRDQGDAVQTLAGSSPSITDPSVSAHAGISEHVKLVSTRATRGEDTSSAACPVPL